MRFQKSAFLALMAAFALLSGCASKPQLPVQLTPSALPAKSERIGIAMTALPKVGVHLPGADCLLCYVAASAMNSGLSKHADTLAMEDLPKLKERVAAALRKKGVNPVVLAEPLDTRSLESVSAPEQNIADRDFKPLKQKHNIDKLLVLEVHAVGFERRYASYIPTSDPKALMRGRGYLVNLATNSYEWYLPVDVLKSADSNWDEPVKFPGLTNAYYQAIEIGADRLVEPLGN